ncbi:MAG: ThuA domain-containing protein [Myxococcota bacterium]
MLKKILLSAVLFFLALLLAAAFYLNSLGILRTPQYDTQAPAIPVLQHPAILVLSKTNGYIHKVGLPAARGMLAELAAENGWHLYQTENAASHNRQDLARFDVVVWNNTSGDILTPAQRADFKEWLQEGGRWLGLHAAGGDPHYKWDWYRDELIGAQFFGHTMWPQFQDADVLVVDAGEALTSHLPNRWRVTQEEWYAFDRNPRETGSKILLVLDESSYDTEVLFIADPTMPGEHPIAWTHAMGRGTVIYSAIGHTAETYANANYREFIRRSISQLVAR